MPVRFKHSDQWSFYFCTFTCYNWLHLIAKSDAYEAVYFWFDLLQKKYEVETVAYVIMPNHIHCILYFRNPGYNLNKIIGNGKVFLSQEIIKRLRKKGESSLLDLLAEHVTIKETEKRQVHHVFKRSFDAKAIYSEKFLFQKLGYIHLNPVTGKWQLAPHFSLYEHSSAAFYENGVSLHFQPCDFRLLF